MRFVADRFEPFGKRGAGQSDRERYWTCASLIEPEAIAGDAEGFGRLDLIEPKPRAPGD